MAHPFLNHFRWKFEATIGSPIDAPRVEEMPKTVEAGDLAFPSFRTPASIITGLTASLIMLTCCCT